MIKTRKLRVGYRTVRIEEDRGGREDREVGGGWRWVGKVEREK